MPEFNPLPTDEELWDERQRDLRATIHVERESQKPMVIGKGGQTIKAISIDARKAISGLTGRACDLFLNVSVTANWTRDPALMQRLGLHEAVGGES